jgi:hypothetical protein
MRAWTKVGRRLGEADGRLDEARLVGFSARAEAASSGSGILCNLILTLILTNPASSGSGGEQIGRRAAAAGRLLSSIRQRGWAGARPDDAARSAATHLDSVASERWLPPRRLEHQDLGHPDL